MAPRTLRTASSTSDSRVSMLTSTTANSDVKPDTDRTFTTLRRATRSTSRSETGPSSTLNLSSFAYNAPSARKRIKREPTPEVKDEPLNEVKDEPGTPLKVKRPRSASSTPIKSSKNGFPKAARVKAHTEPARWREQYALIEHMRAGIDAPVDTMGCERPLTMQDLDPKTLRFHILISLMLSSQTKDAVTSQAVVNLHTILPGGLTAETLAAAPSDTVASAINKVGFWRRKTDYIQEAAQKLLERPGEGRGDVPQTIEELCELKGVGPKMGFLALQVAWSINAGIGVDVHVHRITNRLKWHKPPTKTPEETRINLESWLPPELHRPINPMLVGFGQVICLPVGPRCDLCLLGQQKMCPSRVAVNAAGRKEVTVTFSSDSKPKVEIELEAMAPEEGTPVTVKEEFVDPAATALLAGLEGEGVTEGVVKVKVEDEL